MTGRIGGTALRIILAGVAAGCFGCASKLVRIDSDPGLASIYVNGEYAGKTPLYYNFKDRWRPWPVESTDDYTVTARFGADYLDEEKHYTEESDLPDIGYVPDEITFKLIPQIIEEE